MHDWYIFGAWLMHSLMVHVEVQVGAWLMHLFMVQIEVHIDARLMHGSGYWYRFTIVYFTVIV